MGKENKDRFFIVELIDKTKNIPNDLFAMAVMLLFKIIQKLKGNKNLMEKLNEKIYERRKDFWGVFLDKFVDSKGIADCFIRKFIWFLNIKLNLINRFYFIGKTKYTTVELAKINQFSIQIVCDIYILLMSQPSDANKRAKTLIDELVQYFNDIETEKYTQIIDTIKQFGEIQNKAYLNLIRPYRNVFEEAKAKAQQNNKTTYLITLLGNLLNLIDDRSLETVSSKITQAEGNISKISEDLVVKDVQIKKSTKM